MDMPDSIKTLFCCHRFSVTVTPPTLCMKIISCTYVSVGAFNVTDIPLIEKITKHCGRAMSYQIVISSET